MLIHTQVEEGVEWALTETIRAGQRAGLVKGNDLKRITIDTTVVEKNIAHRADARLYETARRKLIRLAGEAGLSLCQNYNRLGPRLAGQIGRYAHARQFKRMRNDPTIRPVAWQGKAFIQGGRKFLRDALYMPALVAARHNPDLRQRYRTMIQDGKPAKVALTALMRKMIELANALVHQDRKWTPKKA